MLRARGTKRVKAVEVEKIHRKRQKLDLSAHFILPQLDLDGPCAEQSPNMNLPLYEFQRRSLHKMVELENNPEFKLKKKIQIVKGGVLADEVGLGKTATSVGLIITDPQTAEGYGNLVITPTHLCHQWQTEIMKFSELRSTVVRSALDHASVKRFKGLDVVIISLDYYKATYANNQNASQKVFHQVKWRRLILDECHEVVKGNELHCETFIKDLLKLRVKNVWLVSGTPFPFGDKSVYAVNSLLGIKLKIFVSNNPFSIAAHNSKTVYKYPLFEKWKKRVCIRNTRAGLGKEWSDISKNSYDVNFREQNVFLEFTKVERAFYDVTRKQIPLNLRKNPFSDNFIRLRQLCCHPSVSSEFNSSFVKERGAYSLDDLQYRMVNLRKRQMLDGDIQNDQLREDIGAAWRTIKHVKGENVDDEDNRYRWSQEMMSGPPDIRYVSLNILKRKIRGYDTPGRNEVCAIHARFIRKANEKIAANKEKREQFQKDVTFFQEMIDSLNSEVKKDGGHSCCICTSTVSNVSITECGHPFCSDCLHSWLAKNNSCPVCRMKINHSKIVVVDTTKAKEETGPGKVSDDPMVNEFGTKMATLLKTLQRLFTSEPTAKVIIFSQYHNCLKLIHQTLLKAKIPNYFSDERMSLETCILRFQSSEKVRTLLLSSTARAAGANLQVANHVIFVDPPGISIPDAIMLEEQAIGRCVRAGQTREVTVTRFIFRDSIEEHLMALIENRKKSRKGKSMKPKVGAKHVPEVKGEPVVAPKPKAKRPRKMMLDSPPPRLPAKMQEIFDSLTKELGIENEQALSALEKARRLYGKTPSTAQVVAILFK